MIKKVNVVILLLFIEILVIKETSAAFCSLRDPVSAIQILYEEGFQFRTLVKTVTKEDRMTVKQLLPFTIHQSEVGKHTLYVMYNNDRLAGFLQARSEWAKWGLIEIAWAINIDRSIKGFYYQRCRSPQCNMPITKKMNTVFKNKNFSQLRALLNENGEALSPLGIKSFKHAPSLALLTLRSALKTLAITDISWEKDIKQLPAI